MIKEHDIQNRAKKIGYIIAIIFCAAVFLIVPQESVTTSYMMKVINEGLIFSIAVLGLSIIFGMGGQITFATAGIMGIGAYATAILTTMFNWEPLAAIIAAVLFAIFISTFLGMALFRLRGTYFAFSTIALSEVLYTIFSNWMDVTGGPDGIKGIPDLKIVFFTFDNYYDYFRIFFIVTIVCFLFVERIRKTYFGRADRKAHV